MGGRGDRGQEGEGENAAGKELLVRDVVGGLSPLPETDLEIRLHDTV
ncbi:hypothetical protein ACFCYX_02440 [Streptomyces populi]